MSSGDLEHSDIIDDDGTALAPAVFARNAEEAERYCELLADHDILGIVAIDADNDDTEIDDDVTKGVGITRGVAVLVEEALLDEASLVIADREDQAEFQFDTDDDDDDDDDDEDEDFDFGQNLDSDFKDDATESSIIPPEGSDVPKDVSGPDTVIDLDALLGLGDLDGFDDDDIDFDELDGELDDEV